MGDEQGAVNGSFNSSVLSQEEQHIRNTFGVFQKLYFFLFYYITTLIIKFCILVILVILEEKVLSYQIIMHL